MRILLQIGIVAIAAAMIAACGGTTEKPANNANTPNANAGNTAAAKPAPPTKEALVTIEKKSWEDWAKKDAKGVDAFMASNFTEVGRSGIFDRAAAAKRWSEHKCEMKSLAFSDEALTEFADGIALLTYKATADISCEGKPQPTPVFSSTLYVREGNTWKAAYYQEVPAADAKGDASPVTATPATPLTGDATPSEAAALEAKLWELWKSKDEQGFKAIMSDKFTGNGTTGRMDGAAMLKAAFAPNCKVDSYKLGPMKTVNISPDFVLVVYRAEQKAACGGNASPSPVSVTGMYRKENGAWKSIYYMETKSDS